MARGSRSGPSDTASSALQLIVEAHRAMSPREKMERVLACNDAAEAMARAGIRARFGDLPVAEQRLRVAALRLDRETMIAAFGWDPDTEPDGR